MSADKLRSRRNPETLGKLYEPDHILLNCSKLVAAARLHPFCFNGVIVYQIKAELPLVAKGILETKSKALL
jgi:hypothetical protein